MAEREHEVDTRTDWWGDPNVINGTQAWVTYYCKVCGAEGDELDDRPCDAPPSPSCEQRDTTTKEIT